MLRKLLHLCQRNKISQQALPSVRYAEIFREGQSGYEAKLTCPYAEGTPESASWHAGLKDAENAQVQIW